MQHSILVVEDDDIVRDFAVEVLRLDGHEVMTAGSVDAARKIIFARPDAESLCLIVDVVLNHESGVAFAQELIKRYAGFRVLLISGYTDDVVMTDPVYADRVAFLAKPFSSAELLAAVKRLWE